MFERFPRHFKQQPLLRIHALRFARRDAEEQRVELIHIADEATETGGHSAWRIGIGVVVRVDIPAIRRHFADRVGAAAQHVPVLLRRVGIARKAAADPDDGDRRMLTLLQRLDATLQLVSQQRQTLGREMTDPGQEIRHL